MKFRRLDQQGAIDVLFIPFILVIIFFFGAAGFGIWAFMSREDYKNNSDQKSAIAVSAAIQRTQAADAKTYAEAAKNPLSKFTGPSDFGNVSVQYPRTWSAYAIQSSGNASLPIDAYFSEGHVSDVNNNSSAFALRVQLVGQTYDQVMQAFQGQQQGQVTVAPYTLPKVPSVIGSIVTGQIENQKQGTMVVLPLRNMTLKIWTDTPAYLPDLSNIVLPNLTFSP